MNRRADGQADARRIRAGERDDPPGVHPPRVRFDTMFTDLRHFRSDCRLMRTAIRRGWLDDASDEDCRALAARFHDAFAALRRDDPDVERVRHFFAAATTMLRMEGDSINAAARLLRYSWKGEIPTVLWGRPRERGRVADHPHRIDANEVRRRAKANGMDLSALWSIDVRPADKPDAPGERIALAAVADARYGWRVWLLCPRCGGRRVHLYPTGAGVLCRGCAGVRYRGLSSPMAMPC